MTLTPEELREHLTPLVAKWWLPDEFAFIDEVPKTSVGKFDKKVLRARLAAGGLDVVAAVFTPGASTQQIIDYVRSAVPERRD